jgi:hypothetical protein
VADTPTPTPTAASAPGSEDEAITEATALFQEFTAMVNLVLDEVGANPERMEAYAISVPLGEFVGSATEIAAGGYQYEGGLVNRVESAYATEAQFEGETLEFGAVQLTYCSDSTGRTSMLPDGTVRPMPADRSPRLEAGIMFDPVKGSWFVRSLTPLGSSCL